MTSDNRDYPGNAEGPGLLPALPLGNGEGAKFLPGLLLAQLKANRTMTEMALAWLTALVVHPHDGCAWDCVRKGGRRGLRRLTSHTFGGPGTWPTTTRSPPKGEEASGWPRVEASWLRGFVAALASHLSSHSCRCGRPLDWAITGQVVRWQVCWGDGIMHWSLQQLACREVGARVSTNVFLRDLDLVGIRVQDQRRIEVIAEGLPVFHGAQLVIDTTLVSPLRADGEPHRRCAEVDGAALVAARRRKERTYLELVGGQWTCQAGRARRGDRRTLHWKRTLFSVSSPGRRLAHSGAGAHPCSPILGPLVGSVLACAAVRAFASAGSSGPPGS